MLSLLYHKSSNRLDICYTGDLVIHHKTRDVYCVVSESVEERVLRHLGRYCDEIFIPAPYIRYRFVASSSLSFRQLILIEGQHSLKPKENT